VEGWCLACPPSVLDFGGRGWLLPRDLSPGAAGVDGRVFRHGLPDNIRRVSWDRLNGAGAREIGSGSLWHTMTARYSCLAQEFIGGLPEAGGVGGHGGLISLQGGNKGSGRAFSVR